MRALEREIGRFGLRGERVLVAVSGGVDSVVLAAALAECAQRDGFELSLGHVHHGLRGAAADADAHCVAELAASLGLPHAERRVDLDAFRKGRRGRERRTLQEAARALRYRALDEIAVELGATRIATAHHADDQAETLLLRLLRGTGPDGLGGIPERSPDGRVLRPFLRVTREQILTFAEQRGLRWREDASNGSLAYARNRLRHRWLPALSRAFNPQLLRNLADLAEAQQRDSEWIRGCVEQESRTRFTLEKAWLCIDTTGWKSLPVALARRLAREALVRAGQGRHVERVHLERMLEFIGNPRAGRRIEVPGGLLLWHEGDRVRLGPLGAGTSTK